jgi:hypothetical protein
LRDLYIQLKPILYCIFWKLDKNRFKIPINDVVNGGECCWYLCGIRTNKDNRNLKPSKKSNLHHFPDKSQSVLETSQAAAKLASFRTFNMTNYIKIIGGIKKE